MTTTSLVTGNLQPNELEAVYSISRTVSETVDIDKALSEIVRLSRPVFIFDNAVLYLQNQENGELEPAFARAIGRGRSSEAELSWGDKAAHEAFRTGKNYLSEAQPIPDTDRLEQGYYLGQPMLVGGKNIGALVFIRFGGPAFTKEQINLAEFIAAHVTQVLEHEGLVKKIANLEAEKRLALLQSDFLATVSHELKTPLGFIKGYSTTLLRKDVEWNSDEQRDFLSIIDEEADHLENLVNNLLDSARLQTGTIALETIKTDLIELSNEIIQRFKVRHPGTVIEFDVGAEDYDVPVDPRRLTQVLENLLSNAVKYAPGSKVRVSLVQMEGKAMIKVEDWGPGISEDHIDHVFERFYRVPNNGEPSRGSGLGLYICEQIVLAHDGHIQVNSTEGKGTVFSIELPMQKEVQPA